MALHALSNLILTFTVEELENFFYLPSATYSSFFIPGTEQH